MKLAWICVNGSKLYMKIAQCPDKTTWDMCYRKSIVHENKKDMCY